MKRRWKGAFIKENKGKRLTRLSKKFSPYTFDHELTDKDENTSSDDLNSDYDVSTQIQTQSGWGEGRRIVEMAYLAEQLRHCKYCGKPLLLHNFRQETRIGYASIIYIDCDCGIMNTVTTGRSHRPESKTGMQVYDINTKAVLGVIHAGITYRQMNALMAAMEIKGLTPANMIRRQQEVQSTIEETAKDSCSEMLREEKLKSANDQETKEEHGAIFKYDMGWQKRGSGRSYDSKSGVGTLIGNSTGKICAFGVKISDCRKCTKAENEENIPPHNCVKNWTGSAKAMEPEVGIEVLKSVEKEGVTVKTLVMDDDTSTMARIRRDLNHSVEKWSDVNHTAKQLTNSLFSLQKKHKLLTNVAIAHLKKCFNYALAQTKGDSVQFRLQLEQIVPHCFGDHKKCGNWCGYSNDPENYKHGTLRTDLSGETLKKDLEVIFSVFSQNAQKIAPGGSTKDVESFNNMVAVKAPKRCHFSATGNLLCRVSCAVAQKNLGNSYLSQINDKLGLSPGRVYKQEAERKDLQRQFQKDYSNKKENKLRKLKRKLKKRMNLNSKEKKEGTTYKSGVALTLDDDTDIIPKHRHQPKMEMVNIGKTLVYCDIETGSLAKDCDILQIAACTNQTNFEIYIKPRKTISPFASNVTGLSSLGGILFLHGSPVCTLSIKEALEEFLRWLKDLSPVVLVGHNFKRFDFPRLIQAFRSVRLEKEFESVCIGGVDTLPIFKAIYPNEDNHKQEYLCEKVLNVKYNAHNAVSDVASLEKLFQYSNVSDDLLMTNSFSTTWGFANAAYQEEMATNAETFQLLESKKIISRQTINKIAGSGLKYHHLQTVFLCQGPSGIKSLLGENIDGSPRVTTCKRIIEKIIKHFKEIE